MEKDINLIIDVEPHEANLLIGLIEILLTPFRKGFRLLSLLIKISQKVLVLLSQS